MFFDKQDNVENLTISRISFMWCVQLSVFVTSIYHSSFYRLRVLNKVLKDAIFGNGCKYKLYFNFYML